MQKCTYMDNAAASRLDERVLEAMRPYFFETYAVATSEFGYSLGIEAREGLDTARELLAQRLGHMPSRQPLSPDFPVTLRLQDRESV